MRLTVLSGALAIALVALASRTDTWRAIEERAEGTAAKWRGPLPWPDDVVVLAVDGATLERHGWPVPRDALAQVVFLAAKSGAKAVGFDAYLVDPTNNDEALAAAARAWPHVVLGAECVAVSERARTLECLRFHLPAGPLANAARLAHLHARPSASGNLRSVFTTARGPGAVTMSTLGVAMLEAAGKPPAGPLPAELLPHWRDSAPVVSLNEVIDEATRSGVDEPSAALKKLFAGKWVLLGQTAASAGDHGPLFTGEQRPLVNLHAAVLADLLEGRQLREAPPAVGLLLLFLSGLLALLAAAFLRPAAAIAALAFIAAAIWAAAVQAPRGDVLVAPVAPLAAAGLAFAAAMISRTGRRDEQRRRLGAAFGGTLDEKLLERVLSDPKQLALGGARKRLTVLFSDVRGYAGLSNDRPAGEVVVLLREYLEVMTRRVKAGEGRVDRLLGDGLLAVFGDPVPLANHAERAVEVALSMQEEVSRLSRKWESQGRSPIAIRIGIATGDVFVGDVGAGQGKIEYTVLGPTVSLAARLEGRAPPGGVLVSAETYRECEAHWELQSVGALALKGFRDVRAAYLAIGPKSSADPERAAPRLRSQAVVKVKLNGQQHPGVVTDVSAGGLFVASPAKAAIGDPVEIEFGTGGILSGPATVTVRGEVRHLREEGFGLEVQRAASDDASAVRHFVALYLGPEALSAQVHSSADGYQVDLT